MPKGDGSKSEEVKKRISAALTGRPKSLQHCKNISKGRVGIQFSTEHRTAISKSRTGKGLGPWSDERRDSWAAYMKQRYKEDPEYLAKVKAAVGKNFRGGRDGDYLASILCPLGYAREYHVVYAFPKRYILDFALLPEKINIELDGAWHMTSQEDDTKRDAHLRSLGWKVIRVKT